MNEFRLDDYCVRLLTEYNTNRSIYFWQRKYTKVEALISTSVQIEN